MSAKALFSALGAGGLFGVGLCISGMTDPKNVLAFLDVTGAWSPKLAGVMLGAIGVHAAWLRFTAQKTASAPSSIAPGSCAANSLAPGGANSARARGVDAALVSGAAIFGVGWGLAGYCPGPAIVSLGSGVPAVLVFVAAMVLGMRLLDAARGLTQIKAAPNTPRDPSAAE